MQYRVRFFQPERGYLKIKDEIDSEIQRVLTVGNLILREDTEKFEQNLAEFVGTRFAVALSSGTDALYLSLKALGIGQGDEVIVPSHTFKATAGAVVNVGAKPGLIDFGNDGLMDMEQVREKITPKTKAVIPVHIAGAMCDMKWLYDIIRDREIVIIEDQCQALGAKI